MVMGAIDKIKCYAWEYRIKDDDVLDIFECGMGYKGGYPATPNRTQVIIKTCADFFKLNVSDLLGPKRNRDHVYGRHIAMYFMRKYTPLPFVDIANTFNRECHSTAITAITSIQDIMTVDAKFRKWVTQMEDTLPFNQDPYVPTNRR